MSTFAFVENLRVATLNICLLTMPIVTKDLIGSHDPESDLSIRCLILYLMCHCRDPARLVETKGTYWEGPVPESDSDFVINRTPLRSEYQSLMSLSCLFLNCILVWRTPCRNEPAPKSPQSKLIASNLTVAPLLTYKVCGQDLHKALQEKKEVPFRFYYPCIYSAFSGNYELELLITPVIDSHYLQLWILVVIFRVNRCWPSGGNFSFIVRA